LFLVILDNFVEKRSLVVQSLYILSGNLELQHSFIAAEQQQYNAFENQRH